MATDYQAFDRPQPRSRARAGWLLLILCMFAGGAAAAVYTIGRWPAAARYLGLTALENGTTTPKTPAAGLLASVPPPAAADQRQQQALDARVAGLEGRIARIGARADAAAGNADRAEGLLVAFAARRAIDRGVALGYIEALLRDRFGANQPQAVATIIAAARQPVTLEELQGGLGDVGQSLVGGGPEETWIDGLRREISSLVIVRRANVPSPDPADRLARARRQVDAGHVSAALAEVARMPGRDKAATWIAAARRYVAARDALDMIETAALLEPRGLQPIPTQADAPPTPEPDPEVAS